MMITPDVSRSSRCKMRAPDALPRRVPRGSRALRPDARHRQQPHRLVEHDDALVEVEDGRKHSNKGLEIRVPRLVPKGKPCEPQDALSIIQPWHPRKLQGYILAHGHESDWLSFRLPRSHCRRGRLLACVIDFGSGSACRPPQRNRCRRRMAFSLTGCN